LNRPEPPPFAEPWEAEALALANELVKTGRVTAAEWASALGAAIRRSEQASGPDDGSNYYRDVLSALEALTIEKALVSRQTLDQRRADWAEAYEHTPHGRPVTLDRSEELRRRI
jgi:nitrile hydratase accessory protein